MEQQIFLERKKLSVRHSPSDWPGRVHALSEQQAFGRFYKCTYVIDSGIGTCVVMCRWSFCLFSLSGLVPSFLFHTYQFPTHPHIQITHIIIIQPSPGQVALFVGVLSTTPKVYGFDLRSGHMPGLQVQSLVRAHMGGNQLMSLSH